MNQASSHRELLAFARAYFWREFRTTASGIEVVLTLIRFDVLDKN